MSEDFICWIVCIFKYKSLHQFYLSQSAGLDESSRRSPVASPWIVSPWTPHTTTRLTPLQKKQFCQYWCPPCPTCPCPYPHLSRRAILACQTISATGAIVATVPTAKEIWEEVMLDPEYSRDRKYSSLRFLIWVIISFNCNFWAMRPMKTHFLSRKLCLAPRYTSPAQCTVFAWKQWSSVSQTYELW